MRIHVFNVVMIVAFVLGANSPILLAQKQDLKYGSQYQGKREDAAMQKFRSNRFGQFIHWGLYAIPGGEWKGKVYPGAAEWLQSSAKISSSSWNALVDKFNPSKYNPDEWAIMAKKMGVKYATITTKHHDGFCLWNSEYTDFDIEATKYNGDLIKEFVEAYKRQGIDVYFYYSILDWHHPDWRNDIKTDEDSIAFERYFQFAKNQLLELQAKFPEVKGFWFDGTWDESWKKNGKYSYEIEMALKAVNPDIIVNSRLRADDYGSRHFDSNGDLMGDYQSGFERFLPKNTDSTIVKMDWESCMTIPVNQWGYHKDWSLSHVKFADEIIEMLVKSVSLNGNFLLNFGPDGNGAIREEEVAIANEIGKWMTLNSDAIYNGVFANLEKQDWGYYIKNTKTNTLYGVLFNKPISNLIKVKLPKNVKLKGCVLSYDGQKSLQIIPHEKHYLVKLPKIMFKHPVVLEFKLE